MLCRALFHESAEVRKLTVLDFDDTIVSSNSMVRVTDSKSGKTRKLTPGEYAVYNPKPDDVFDYSEFDQIKEPTEIKAVTNGLRKVTKVMSGHDVFILTARGSYKPIKDYLKDIGINTNKLHVVALGDSNPQKKADWIEEQIDKNGYNDIYFIDDSIKNVRAVKRMLQTKSDIRFKVRHAKY